MDGAKLKAARLRKGLTQKELAERLLVGNSTVERWEGGECTPQPLHMHRLCEELDVTTEELLGVALEGPTPPVFALTPPAPLTTLVYVKASIQEDLTCRLWALTIGPYQEIHTAMARILKDYDKMTSKNLHINRREAMRHLISLSFLSPSLVAALKGEETPSVSASKDLLAQCAVSIAACWELRKSTEHNDLALAFEAASAYLPVLQRIVKDSSEHRREAAGLVIQCLLLKSLLGSHLEGLKESAQYAQQALLYSETAQDTSLHLKVLDRLAVMYTYNKRNRLALETIEQAEPLLKRKSALVPLTLQARINGLLACNAARNGRNGNVYLDQAMMQHTEATKKAEYYPAYVYYEKSELLFDAGVVYCQQDGEKAIETLSEAVDPQTFALRLSCDEIQRIEVINTMTKASLRTENKDMDKTIHFWKAGIQAAKALHSEQRFNEALTLYESMGYIWPNELRIAELHDLTEHW